MSVPSVTLRFSARENAPTLRACLEQLIQNLHLEPEEEPQDETANPLG